MLRWTMGWTMVQKWRVQRGIWQRGRGRGQLGMSTLVWHSRLGGPLEASVSNTSYIFKFTYEIKVQIHPLLLQGHLTAIS